MPILKKTESTFEPVPAGTHLARCFSMVSLGTQPSKNPTYKPSFQVVLQFELPNETIEYDGKKKPMMTTQFLNAYLGSVSKPSKTNLFLTAWRGKPFTETELAGFDLSKVVGAPCVLNIIHETRDGKTREKIASISPLMKGQPCPPQVNQSIIYEIEEGKSPKFAALSEWLQKKISECEEWTAPAHAPEPEAPAAPADDTGKDDDNVPF